jgi:hypothetical protein
MNVAPVEAKCDREGRHFTYFEATPCCSGSFFERQVARPQHTCELLNDDELPTTAVGKASPR